MHECMCAGEGFNAGFHLYSVDREKDKEKMETILELMRGQATCHQMAGGLLMVILLCIFNI